MGHRTASSVADGLRDLVANHPHQGGGDVGGLDDVAQRTEGVVLHGGGDARVLDVHLEGSASLLGHVLLDSHSLTRVGSHPVRVQGDARVFVLQVADDSGDDRNLHPRHLTPRRGVEVVRDVVEVLGHRHAQHLLRVHQGGTEQTLEVLQDAVVRLCAQGLGHLVAPLSPRQVARVVGGTASG